MNDKPYVIGSWKYMDCNDPMWDSLPPFVVFRYHDEYSSYEYRGFELTKEEMAFLMLKYDTKIKHHTHFNHIVFNEYIPIIDKFKILNELRPDE